MGHYRIAYLITMTSSVTNTSIIIKLVFLANQLILWESSKEKVRKATIMIFRRNVIMT